jgi:hypothetical protein
MEDLGAVAVYGDSCMLITTIVRLATGSYSVEALTGSVASTNMPSEFMMVR